MPQKVTWKKGMRLTAELFEAMDAATAEHVRLSNVLSIGGRFGLFFDGKPFEISINVINNILEVVNISCRGVTKNGKIIDIDFDSAYNKSLDTRVVIPDNPGEDSYILAIRVNDGEWVEVNDKLSAAALTFELIGENSTIDGDLLPIANIVNEYGWRLNETDFVPPCLYVIAHQKYIDIYKRIRTELKVISDLCEASTDCIAVRLLERVWTASASGYSILDKQLFGLTPEKLYDIIQGVVRAFVIGCALDENISLEDPEPFIMYSRRGYDLRNLYRDIERGLEVCKEINIKMSKVVELKSHPEPEIPQPTPKPKPKPLQPPIPTPARRGWEGYEI